LQATIEDAFAQRLVQLARQPLLRIELDAGQIDRQWRSGRGRHGDWLHKSRRKWILQQTNNLPSMAPSRSQAVEKLPALPLRR
jgi:hypothetical protein